MKKKMITLSIGIPAYNEEANIGQLFTSLLTQVMHTFVLKEIIVISDGSTDETVKEVKKIKDSRIKLISTTKRLGQNVRQNQLLKTFANESDYLLIIEADTLPVNDMYVQELVNAIPKDARFSIVNGISVPFPAKTLFGVVMNFAFMLRSEIFTKAISLPNVYIHAESGILSREFIKQFSWDTAYNEDSYCYRKAIASGLPIIHTTKAKKYYKTVENMRDYLLQSGKFIRAREQEEKTSDIYSPKINRVELVKILIKYFLSNPMFFSLYLIFLLISRLYKNFLPMYSPLWNIYTSSKRMEVVI